MPIFLAEPGKVTCFAYSSNVGTFTSYSPLIWKARRRLRRSNNRFMAGQMCCDLIRCVLSRLKGGDVEIKSKIVDKNLVLPFEKASLRAMMTTAKSLDWKEKQSSSEFAMAMNMMIFGLVSMI